MSSNIIDFSEEIKKRVLDTGKEKFNQSLACGIQLGFSMHEFESLNNNLYQLYQFKGEITHYIGDMDLFITNAIVAQMESSSRVLNLEDILDSIWDITVNKDKTIEKVKAKYLGKLYKSM